LRANPARIASGPFTEQHILNEVLARLVVAAGFRPDQRPGMSEGLQFKGLVNDQIDCMINYSGNLWTLVMQQKEIIDPEETVKRIKDYLLQRHGVVCLGSLGFENNYALAMPQRDRRPEEFKTVRTLAEMAEAVRRSRRPLRVGGDMQFFERPEWGRLKEVHRLDDECFITTPMGPELMYDAVVDGQVDAIVAYSSDGRIPAYRLEVLDDTQRALPKYQALLLVSRRAARNARLVESLLPLIGAIRQEDMQQANRQVDVKKQLARTAAAELLTKVK
jgi:osmoprotectant transport system permease protein